MIVSDVGIEKREYVMPCISPLQGKFVTIVRKDGCIGRKFVPLSSYFDSFKEGKSLPLDAEVTPCGQCGPCRLERSRQWGVRCLHEAKLWSTNCFITLTYGPDFLPSDGSLDRDVMKKFLKDLRSYNDYYRDKAGLEPSRIRVFYCGEYGELCKDCGFNWNGCRCFKFKPKLGRPHYHAILFNYDFVDKKYFKTVNGQKYYTSDTLSRIWGKGFCTIGDVTFESSAYVARYCMKKINGEIAAKHYGVLLPEFCQASLKPGIGSAHFDKYGLTDIFPLDECVINGRVTRPPRFYDKCLEKIDPDLLAGVKELRSDKASLHASDNTYSRLLQKQKYFEQTMKLLIRNVDKGV